MDCDLRDDAAQSAPSCPAELAEPAEPLGRRAPGNVPRHAVVRKDVEDNEDVLAEDDEDVLAANDEDVLVDDDEDVQAVDEHEGPGHTFREPVPCAWPEQPMARPVEQFFASSRASVCTNIVTHSSSLGPLGCFFGGYTYSIKFGVVGKYLDPPLGGKKCRTSIRRRTL